ncbi:hypothetical protein [Bacteroides sp.]
MDIFFPSYTCLIYLGCSGQLSDFVLQTHPHPQALISSFCTSGQMFAVGFLQIPPHDGHPYPWLYASRCQGALRTRTR